LSTRSNILDALLQRFITDGVVHAHRSLRYLHEVNDFPTVCLGRFQESRMHIGAGVRLHQIVLPIRGYVYGSIGDAEALARLLEASVDNYSKSPLVCEARVITFRTDEGLFEPYAQIDLTVEITYEV